MGINIGTIRTFADLPSLTVQSRKVHEEAGEVLCAVSDMVSLDFVLRNKSEHARQMEIERENIRCECADLIQALANLLALLDEHDMTRMMERTREKNEARGRAYE